MRAAPLAKYRADAMVSIANTRFCSHCQAYRPADTFHKRISGPRQVRYICADCWGRIQAHRAEMIRGAQKLASLAIAVTALEDGEK